MKPGKALCKETGILLLGTLLLGGVLCGVFALLHRFDHTVVTGALWGGLASVLNFFVMGLTIQSAVDKDPDAAKKRIQLSYSVRMFALLIVLGVGCYLKQFQAVAVLASALFPRITILVRSMFLKKEKAENGGDSAE